jgi:iron complex transport system ATP-binding protein
MDPDLPIPGIRIRHDEALIQVLCDTPLTCLSSSFHGGGYRRVRHILNARVEGDYRSDDPSADLRTLAGRHGIGDPFVGLLTAVPLHAARLAVEAAEGVTVCALVTAGVGNATRAGHSPPCTWAPGTINIILLVDARLTRGALANALITATEAKCAALAELDIRCPDGSPATGTSTDTVTIASTGRGAPRAYAGTATAIGWLIGRTVRAAVKASLEAQ